MDQRAQWRFDPLRARQTAGSVARGGSAGKCDRPRERISQTDCRRHGHEHHAQRAGHTLFKDQRVCRGAFRQQRPRRCIDFGRLTIRRAPPTISRSRSSAVDSSHFFYRSTMNFIQQNDPDVWSAIDAEARRQQDGLEMIASENYVSPAIMQAAGSVLTNKYAEGYPGRRYYGGCEHVDVVETLARDRAKQLFGAEHANVQPHSGSQANFAVYVTALEPGDSVLGLDLAHGGHLTHGMKLNLSGKLYHFHSYGVTK